MLIHQTRSINTKNKEQKITKILPKDLWGETMTDDSRIKIKNECESKTIELLGEPDE